MAEDQNAAPSPDLGVRMVRNMAMILETERQRRHLGKAEFAKACTLTTPEYLSILETTANPTLLTVTQISEALSIPFGKLLLGDPGAVIA